MRAIDDVGKRDRFAAATSPRFDALCHARAGVERRGTWLSPAANGAVIEQAQILTTQNLATLTGPFGVGDGMALDHAQLARRCFERARRSPAGCAPASGGWPR